MKIPILNNVPVILIVVVDVDESRSTVSPTLVAAVLLVDCPFHRLPPDPHCEPPWRWFSTIVLVDPSLEGTMEQPDGYSFKVTTMCLAELNFGSMRTAAFTHSCAKRYSGVPIQ